MFVQPISGSLLSSLSLLTITTIVVEFLFDLPIEFSGSNQTPIHPSVGISLADYQPLLTAPSSAPMRSPMTLELASFKKSIKREASAYSVLKDEHFFDKFQRDHIISAKSHDVSEILTPLIPQVPHQRKGNYLNPSKFSCIKFSNFTDRYGENHSQEVPEDN